MRYYAIIIMVIFAFILGCSSEVAKDTAKETAKDVSKGVESGIKDLATEVGEAAPYIKEDISEGFWNALDTIGEAMGVPTSEPLPKAGDPEHRKLHAKVDAFVQKGVVESVRRIEEKKTAEISEALNILDQVIKEEIVKASESGKPGEAPGTEPAKVMPTPEQVAAAWEALAQKVGGRPAAVRKLFENILNFVNTHPEYKSQAGIAGPIAKEKIGQKAQEFLATLKVGEISKPFKFMRGYVIVQVIDDTPDKIEVGYIYMPEEAVEQASTTTPSAGQAESPAPGSAPGAAPGGG